MACVPCLYACGFGVKTIARLIGWKNHVSVQKVLRRNSIPASPRGKWVGGVRATKAEWSKVVLAQAHSWSREWADAKKIDERRHWNDHPDAPSMTMISYYKNHKQNKERARVAARNLWIKMRGNRHFMIKRRVSHHLWKALKCQGIRRKPERTMELVGCTLEQFKQWIEAKFVDGMTWENYGRWELDHVIPKSTFNLSKPNERRACFHYSNYQPLWREDNRRKWAKTIRQAELAI